MSMSNEKQQIVDAFLRNPMFGDFAISDLEQASSAFFIREFPAGTLLLAEDEPNEGLAFVEAGLLRSTKNVPNFGQKELSSLGPGDVIGEVSLVDELPHAASVRCVDPSRLILSPRDRLEGMFRSSNALKAKFYGIFTRTISRYLRDVNQRLHSFFQPGQDKPDRAPTVRDRGHHEEPGWSELQISQKLQELELFQGLSSRQLALLSSVIRVVPVDRNEVIFREGARGDNLYLVAAGAVRISKFFAGIGEEALTVLSPGEFFGDMSLFDDKPRSATAIGNSDETMLFSIGRGSLEEMARSNMEAGCALYELLARIQCKRLRNTINTVSFWQILSGQPTES